MSPEEIVRAYVSEGEASLGAAILGANGSEAATRSANSGFGFHTTLAGRTSLIVRGEDVARARALLDSPAVG